MTMQKRLISMTIEFSKELVPHRFGK